MRKTILLTLMILPFFSAFPNKNTDIRRDTLHLDEVIVTGTNIRVNKNNLPYTISTLNNKQIQESGETALLSVLSGRIPGLFVTERGITGYGISNGSAGGISIRGVGGQPTTQVLMLIDGQPQFAGIFGHHLADSYTTSEVERVEVIRGPASTLYGSNAMGGVINIITKTKKNDGVKTEAQAMYGSYNTMKYLVNNGIKKDKFDSFVSINYDKTDGHRKESSFDIVNGFGKIGWTFNEHIKTSAFVSLAKYNSIDPGSVYNATPFKNHWIDIFRGNASVDINNYYKNIEGALKIFYAWGDHKIYDGFLSEDNNLGVLLYQNLKLFEGNNLTAGIDYKRYGGMAWMNTKTNQTKVVDKFVNEIAGYISLQQYLMNNKLSVNGGLRLDHNSTYGNVWVPQTGIAFRPNAASSVKLSVSKGYRNPTIKDLYMFPPQNKYLRPEKMWNYELSYSHGLLKNHLLIDASVYYSKGSNLIQMITTSEGKKKLENTGNFRNTGAEISLTAQVNDKINLQGNYSYLYMKKPITGAPEHLLFGSITYTPVSKLSFVFQCRYINGLWLNLNNPEKKENYTSLNGKISYHPCKMVELFCLADNILDQQYEINYGYPMPGFTVTGGVNLCF